MKIKSDRIVAELDLVRPERSLGIEKQARRAEQRRPRHASVYINLSRGHFQGIRAWLG